MIIFISFILELIFSNYKLGIPLFTILSLKKFKNNYIFLFIIGLIYDIVYTNILFLNSFLFITIFYIMNKYKSKYPILNLIILLILYQSLLFLCLGFIKYYKWNLYNYFLIIIKSLPINIIYFRIIENKKHTFN